MISHLNFLRFLLVLAVFAASSTRLTAGVGDPQVATDHPWYPGELACSDFQRLQATQARLYQREIGVHPSSDVEKSLASWYWRNTHFWHGEPGVEDLWGKGFNNDADTTTRDYWTGLFAHGFGLCGTTHAQWTAEFQQLLGHNRSRVVGVDGHNSFEVYLQSDPYGPGRWVLLDHDISTIVYDQSGKRLLSIAEISKDVKRWTQQDVAAEKQNGWIVCGLHPDDGLGFANFHTAEYLAGYAGPPPMVHLRRGETLRRYFAPGLEDGKTFVYWGRNYNAEGIPGPERSRTWVNQPEKMYGSTAGAGYRSGQARFANAVYHYRPDFTSSDYREGIVDESDSHVTFRFLSPYIIAATPASDEAWAVYKSGCKNGLIIRGEGSFGVSISTDDGQTWFDAGHLDRSLDLTDFAKGHRHYWLRIHASAKQLEGAGLEITTVCQANSSILPQLKDGGTRVAFAASGEALVSAGPEVTTASKYVTDGAFDTPRVTMQLQTPHGEPATGVYSVAHIASSNPPSPEVLYQTEYSIDSGKTWAPIVRDWNITRQGEEPEDFWSQSFSWGQEKLDNVSGPVQVRFRNNGGKRYRRSEVHLRYKLPDQDDLRVTFHWNDAKGTHTESHIYAATKTADTSWTVPTDSNTKTLWVEYSPVIR